MILLKEMKNRGSWLIQSVKLYVVDQGFNSIFSKEKMISVDCKMKLGHLAREKVTSLRPSGDPQLSHHNKRTFNMTQHFVRPVVCSLSMRGTDDPMFSNWFT